MITFSLNENKQLLKFRSSYLPERTLGNCSGIYTKGLVFTCIYLAGFYNNPFLKTFCLRLRSNQFSRLRNVMTLRKELLEKIISRRTESSLTFSSFSAHLLIFMPRPTVGPVDSKNQL